MTAPPPQVPDPHNARMVCSISSLNRCCPHRGSSGPTMRSENPASAIASSTSRSIRSDSCPISPTTGRGRSRTSGGIACVADVGQPTAVRDEYWIGAEIFPPSYELRRNCGHHICSSQGPQLLPALVADRQPHQLGPGHVIVRAVQHVDDVTAPMAEEVLEVRRHHGERPDIQPVEGPSDLTAYKRRGRGPHTGPTESRQGYRRQPGDLVVYDGKQRPEGPAADLRRTVGVAGETGGSTQRMRACRVMAVARCRSVPRMPSHDTPAIQIRWRCPYIDQRIAAYTADPTAPDTDQTYVCAAASGIAGPLYGASA